MQRPIKRTTRPIRIGRVTIGAGHPVAIQSMAKTRACDVRSTVAQIRRLEQAGCEIVRVAVRDHADARALRSIKKNISLPLVADIHFDWQLAMEAIESGVDKIRLNPGNIFRKAHVREICAAARLAGIPIRVGLNSGSVGGGRDRAAAMVRKAGQYLRMLEGLGFRDIVVSLKAETARDTVAACRAFAKTCEYPLHLGVTATGAPGAGLAKSYAALGALLLDGIGDTIRISLTDRPEEEVRAARLLLQSLDLRDFGPQIVSCPTCGRCDVNLIAIVRDLERRLRIFDFGRAGKPVTVAVMGCVVNGPGEARHADIGIAFGPKSGLLFEKGKPSRKVAPGRAVDVLVNEIRKLT
ncbi:MAG: flavodoxin-dependent (E)-4-hydroxy-3-methylbut-2-enyl-diphosphate synthase [Candidatus Omnitrophica bacterium]|nr:flavodoxin-dependent (E)-4-hydroxy-3-methylbut-2-enyl-diphosphate synthase [Candidatus Omnitrophota bacterium]